MALRTASGAMHSHLNNNTPVNTEVLWGGGLWWELGARTPVFKQDQQIANVDKSVPIDIRRWNL